MFFIPVIPWFKIGQAKKNKNVNEISRQKAYILF